MDFTRGDPAYHTLAIPAANWTPGGKLFFAAKAAIGDDNDDSTAVIQGEWDDGAVSDVELTVAGVTAAYKQYACTFPPDATNSVESGGAASASLLGEYQFVNADGVPMTSPAVGDKIPVTLWFDVKRKTVV